MCVYVCRILIIGARNEHEKTNVTDEHGSKREREARKEEASSIVCFLLSFFHLQFKVNRNPITENESICLLCVPGRSKNVLNVFSIWRFLEPILSHCEVN